MRFLDLARATEGREACNRCTSDEWITPLILDVGEGRCLTEFYAGGTREGACLRGSDGNLHAVTGVTTATAGHAG